MTRIGLNNANALNVLNQIENKAKDNGTKTDQARMDRSLFGKSKNLYSKGSGHSGWCQTKHGRINRVRTGLKEALGPKFHDAIDNCFEQHGKKNWAGRYKSGPTFEQLHAALSKVKLTNQDIVNAHSPKMDDLVQKVEIPDLLSETTAFGDVARSRALGALPPEVRSECSTGRSAFDRLQGQSVAARHGIGNDDIVRDIDELFRLAAQPGNEDFERDLIYCLNTVPDDKMFDFVRDLTQLGPGDGNCGDLLLDGAKRIAEGTAYNLASQDVNSSSNSQNSNEVGMGVVTKRIKQAVSNKIVDPSFAASVATKYDDTQAQKTGSHVTDVTEIAEFQTAFIDFLKFKGELPGTPQFNWNNSSQLPAAAKDVLENQKGLLADFHAAVMDEMVGVAQTMIKDKLVESMSARGSNEESRLLLDAVATANGKANINDLNLVDVSDDDFFADPEKYTRENVEVPPQIATNFLKEVGLCERKQGAVNFSAPEPNNSSPSSSAPPSNEPSTNESLQEFQYNNPVQYQQYGNGNWLNDVTNDNSLFFDDDIDNDIDSLYETNF